MTWHIIHCPANWFLPMYGWWCKALQKEARHLQGRQTEWCHVQSDQSYWSESEWFNNHYEWAAVEFPTSPTATTSITSRMSKCLTTTADKNAFQISVVSGWASGSSCVSSPCKLSPAGGSPGRGGEQGAQLKSQSCLFKPQLGRKHSGCCCFSLSSGSSAGVL